MPLSVRCHQFLVLAFAGLLIACAGCSGIILNEPDSSRLDIQVHDPENSYKINVVVSHSSNDESAYQNEFTVGGSEGVTKIAIVDSGNYTYKVTSVSGNQSRTTLTSSGKWIVSDDTTDTLHINITETGNLSVSTAR
ncbi:hypothetical protein JCM9743_37420 [Natrinema sp. JCM 9743]